MLNSSELAKVQKTQLKILVEFEKICNENELTYHLFAGTLLGAVRHKGFIPWDDDIDVAMIREDYEKFQSICKTELANEFFLQNSKTDPEYPMQFLKIRLNDTRFVESDFQDCDMHHGIYIDVFPLDNIAPNSLLGVIQRLGSHFFRTLNRARVKRLCLKSNNKIVVYGRLSVHHLLKIIPVKCTNKIHLKFLTMFSKRETEYISHLTNGATKKRYEKYKLKRNEYYKTTQLEFENKKFNVPLNYEEILKNVFGDYKKLPPKEERVPHHGIIKLKV